MEDDLKILKVEYFSNHLLHPTQLWLLDHTQILNLSLDDQTILYKSFIRKRPPMEDDFKILKSNISETAYVILVIF